MTDPLLQSRLEAVGRRFHAVWLARRLAACWATAALVACGFAGLAHLTGWSSVLTAPLLGALAVAAALGLTMHHFTRRPDPRWVARRIEARYPELNGLLLTAIQQDGQEGGFLRDRIIQEAVARSQQSDWRKVVPGRRLMAMHALHLLALAGFVFAWSGLPSPVSVDGQPVWNGPDGVTITPGDATLEKGESLVVLARFRGALPPDVKLVVRPQNAPLRTVPLVRSLADPVFGGSVPEVAADFTYQVDYRGTRSREFQVRVFEHPRLVRADAELAYPGYTGLAPKRIEDTRRVSAVEGTRLTFTFHLNKPVRSGQWVTRDASRSAVPLEIVPGQPEARLTLTPSKGASYDLELVDDEGRPAKASPPFVVDVQPNRRPEIRLASPRGDVRPSPLEEVVFEGTVWDDFGSPRHGLTFAVAGGTPRSIELGGGVPAREKRGFRHVLRLEELGVKPDELVSWHAWAEDIGPDGQVRRTESDLFFGEVRAFDEIFRESQDMAGDESEPPPGGGQGRQAQRLGELQKQIISATWKLQREGKGPKYADDVKVVRDSQQQALAQASEALGEARGPREQAVWKEATTRMIEALEQLDRSAADPGPLAQALPPEQAAYQALLRLQSRETAVTRRQRQQRGGGGGGQASQRQIDQLDLKQSENRYETQRQARAPQNEERREQLAVMNRLQELARRQQDLNDRLKELQTALQEAKSEEERDDVRRRLRRLQEEQQQMLADADEVRQRMDRPANQSAMSPQRQQLDQTREDLQRAADAAGQGSVAQALASGTRAQRQLQELRDDLRKRNSGEFAEDLRELRQEARDLSRQQEEAGRKIDELATGRTARRSLGDEDGRKALTDQLAEQQERTRRLVDRATQLSEQAENSEPLLSRQLYDSIRKLSQDEASSVRQAREDLLSDGALSFELRDRLDQTGGREGAGKALEVARELVKDGALPQAGRAARRARQAGDDLRRGIERAAERVLGDDAEQLRLAQTELDQLTEALRRELAPGDGATPPGASGPGATTQPERTAGAERAGGSAEPRAGSNPEAREGSAPGPREGRAPPPGETAAAGAGGPEQNPAGGSSAGANDRPGQPGSQSGRAGSEERRLAGADGRRTGGGRAGAWDELLEGPATGGGGGIGGWSGGAGPRGPLTGEDFNRWNERLRDVEQLVEAPDLRNAVAVAGERARELRRQFRQDMKKPDWTVVQLQVVKPLVEVRERLADELARRDSRESLAPVDRDPVPGRFAEPVRRYYEELGRAPK